ncbi:MAG: hypothetical protein HY908_19555 [Myxococcales bacterium]|nr:hypothetical protein [Myxococcales bacterium]
MKSPLTTRKDRFETKTKLVEAVEQFLSDELWVARLSKDRGGDKGLKHVSNAKLLRLHAIFTEVKEKFGTRAKLIDAIADKEKRTGDAGFKTRLEAYPVPRLYDLLKATTRRVVRAAKASK